MTHYRLQC